MIDASLQEMIFDSLLKTLKEENSPVSRVEAVSNIGLLTFEKAFIILSLGLQDNEAEVRKKATSHIGKIVGKASSEKALLDVVMLLSKAVKDSDHTVREEAISSLGKIDSEESIKILLKVLKDREAEIIIKAVSSLGEMYTKNFNVFSTKANIRNIVVELHQILESQVIMVNSVISVLENISDSYSIPNLAKYQDKMDITYKIVMATINSIKLSSENNKSDPIMDAIKDLGKNMSESKPQPIFNFHDKVGQVVAGDQNVTGDNIGTQNNYHGKHPDTQQLANELDELLQGIVSQNSDSNSEAGKEIITAAAIEAIEKKPSLNDRLAAAFKAGTFEAIKQFAKNPFVEVVLAALKAALEAKPKK
jgi:hypothetical protein